MRKILLLAIVFFGIQSCSVDPEEPNITLDQETSVSNTISVDMALENLYAMMQILPSEAPSCRSFDSTKAIREIKASGGSQATRSGDCDLPDTMVYVVNFSDDKGFAILGAQPNMEPVYAITEAGTFDHAKLDAAIAEAQARQTDTAETQRAPASDEPKFIPQIGTDIIYDLLAESMVAAPRITSQIIETTFGEWVVDPTVSVAPLVRVKWNQTYPFNMYMPYNDSLHPAMYHEKQAVGCGIVAAAQVMATVRQPLDAIAGYVQYPWSRLLTVSNYRNFETFLPTMKLETLSTNAQTATKQLADFLHKLGISMEAAYFPDGTTAVVYPQVIRAMQKYSSYYNNMIHVDLKTNVEKVISALKDGKPIYISADNAKVGHAWVLDGYAYCSRKITQKVLHPGGLITTSVATVHDKMFHCNWGYQGRYDGYFIVGIFDQTQRQLIDNVIDTNNKELGSKNYTFNQNVLLY